jgi:hypothetical protein
MAEEIRRLLLEDGNFIQLEDLGGVLLLEELLRLPTWFRGSPDAEQRAANVQDASRPANGQDETRVANVQDELRLSTLQGGTRTANVQEMASGWRH